MRSFLTGGLIMNKKENNENGASLFARSANLIDLDPMEEIFALNMGDFLIEHLISDELVGKMAKQHNKNAAVENLKTQLNELISIYSINNTLNILGLNQKDDYLIYNSIASSLTQMLDVKVCHILLTNKLIPNFDNKQNDLILCGTSNEKLSDDITKKDLGLKLENNQIVKEVFEKNEAVLAKYGDYDFEFDKEYTEEDLKYTAIIPMHNNLGHLGIIILHNNEAIANHYIKLATVLSTLFATSLYLQKLINETRLMIKDPNSNEMDLKYMRSELTSMICDLGIAQQNFVEALANSVNEKSEYKTNHAQNVAALSKEICKQLELNEKTTDLIYYAGLLQNIGKIILPQTIFSKSGKLTKEEWQKLNDHTNFGVNLLMNINFLSEIIPYIHYNRERYDGVDSQYGLKGNSIPLGSRIIAVADAYCALTSDRPHREKLSNEEALEIIKSEASSKWDPIIVDTLFKIKANQ